MSEAHTPGIPAAPTDRSWHIPGNAQPLLLTFTEAEVQCSVRGRLPTRDDLERIRGELWEEAVSGDFWTAETERDKRMIFSISPGRAATRWRSHDDPGERLKVLCV